MAFTLVLRSPWLRKRRKKTKKKQEKHAVDYSPCALTFFTPLAKRYVTQEIAIHLSYSIAISKTSFFTHRIHHRLRPRPFYHPSYIFFPHNTSGSGVYRYLLICFFFVPHAKAIHTFISATR